MVLLVFRLNKTTGVSASYTLGKELSFSKCVLKAVEFELPKFDEPNGGNAPTTGPLPIYLECSLFNDNRVLFYQSANTTLANAVDNLLPIGAVGIAPIYREFNLTIIDQITDLTSTDTISFTLKQIQEGVVTNLVPGQAFGGDTNTSTNDTDHGVNLYFEFTTTANHDDDQSFNIANAS